MQWRYENNVKKMRNQLKDIYYKIKSNDNTSNVHEISYQSKKEIHTRIAKKEEKLESAS